MSSIVVSGRVPGDDYSDMEYPADYWLGEVIYIGYDRAKVYGVYSYHVTSIIDGILG